MKQLPCFGPLLNHDSVREINGGDFLKLFFVKAKSQVLFTNRKLTLEVVEHNFIGEKRCRSGEVAAGPDETEGVIIKVLHFSL